MEELNIQGILSFVFHLSLNPTVYPANVSPQFHFLSGRGSPSPGSVGHVFPIFQPVGCRKCFCNPEKADKAPWLVHPLLEADLLAKSCLRSQSELAQIAKQWSAWQLWWWVFIFSYFIHQLLLAPTLSGRPSAPPQGTNQLLLLPIPRCRQWHWWRGRAALRAQLPGRALSTVLAVPRCLCTRLASSNHQQAPALALGVHNQPFYFYFSSAGNK